MTYENVMKYQFILKIIRRVLINYHHTLGLRLILSLPMHLQIK